MTVREWLLRGWKVNREIDALLRAKRETFDRITSATSRMDGEPVRSSPDPHKFDRYVELEDLIDSRIDELVGIKGEIIGVVSGLSDERYRSVLLRRYVNFEKWEQIALDMNYSYKQVRRLHAKALILLEGEKTWN